MPGLPAPIRLLRHTSSTALFQKRVLGVRPIITLGTTLLYRYKQYYQSFEVFILLLYTISVDIYDSVVS